MSGEATNRDAPAIERVLVATVPWLVGGLLASLPLLLVDTGDDPQTPFLIHLSLLVLLGLVLSVRLTPQADASWFRWTGWSVHGRLIASGVSVIVLVTGVVGLVTLATSAALRYDPSTQFLQLLSALDIAWAGAAIVVGATRIWNRAAGVLGGIALGVFCIWSIWNYLRMVGFGADGSWIVRGDDLMRLVIPYDMAAAVVAVILFGIGVYRAGVTVQDKPQS